MSLLIIVDFLSLNIYYLLITQCSQNGKLIVLSLRSNFWLERIFKPFSDMWPSLRCHIIVNSFLEFAIEISSSWYVLLCSMYKFVAISLLSSLQAHIRQPSWFHFWYKIRIQGHLIIPLIVDSSLRLSHVIVLKWCKSCHHLSLLFWSQCQKSSRHDNYPCTLILLR